MTRLESHGCPDWERLVEAQEQFDATLLDERAAADDLDERGIQDERAWQAALDHQRSCRPCRESVLAHDPTTLFQSMPQVELEASEVAAMRERVHGVLRGRSVGHSERSSHWGGTSTALGGVAAVVMVLLGYGAWGTRAPGQESLRGEIAAASPALGMAAPVELATLSSEDEALLEAALGARPLVEGVERLAGVFGESEASESERFVLMQGVLGGGVLGQNGAGAAHGRAVGAREVDFAWIADGRFDL